MTDPSPAASHVCSGGPHEALTTLLLCLFVKWRWATKRGCSGSACSLQLPVGAVDHCQVRPDKNRDFRWGSLQHKSKWHIRVTHPALRYPHLKDLFYVLKKGHFILKHQWRLYILYVALSKIWQEIDVWMHFYFEGKDIPFPVFCWCTIDSREKARGELVLVFLDVGDVSPIKNNVLFLR